MIVGDSVGANFQRKQRRDWSLFERRGEYIRSEKSLLPRKKVQCRADFVARHQETVPYGLKKSGFLRSTSTAIPLTLTLPSEDWVGLCIQTSENWISRDHTVSDWRVQLNLERYLAHPSTVYRPAYLGSCSYCVTVSLPPVRTSPNPQG